MSTAPELFAGARENAVVIGSPQGIVLYRGTPVAFSEEHTRLFAASPELLAAAEECAAALDAWSTLPADKAKHLRNTLRAAIRKARKGTP